MIVLKNRRFVDGKGRRYIDKVAESLHPYGFTTPTTVNSAFGGTESAIRINPFLVRS
jgi:hypothetical protein